MRLVIIPDSFGGGIGATVHSQVAYALRRGDDVHVVRSDRAIAELDCPTHPVPLPDSFWSVDAVRASLRLRRLLRDLRPDVIHCHGLRSFALTLMAGHRSFVTLHGAGMQPGRRIYMALKHLGMSLTPLLARGGFAVFPTERGRWLVLVHPSPHLDPARRSAGRVPHGPTLWLGRLDPPKRPDLLIAAAAAAGTDLLVVGGGSLEAATRAQAERLGVRAEFRPPTDQVLDLMESAGAFVLMSDSEGLPYSVQEALWTATPIVASPLPGITFVAGGAALYAQDVDELADQLRCLQDPEERRARSLASAAVAAALPAAGTHWATVWDAYLPGG